MIDLFQDHEGNVWVSTYSGLDCFRRVPITVFGSQEGFQAREFDGLLATRDGKLWVGGSNSLDQSAAGNVTSYVTGKQLPGDQVTAMLEDSRGRIWIGVDQRLYIFQDGSFREVKGVNGSRFGFVKSLCETKDGDIWAQVFSTPRKLVHLRNEQVFQVFPPPSGAPRKVGCT